MSQLPHMAPRKAMGIDVSPEPVTVKDEEIRLCRVCGNVLYGTEKTIGVHVWCVHTVQNEVKTSIKAPKYGSN